MNFDELYVDSLSSVARAVQSHNFQLLQELLQDGHPSTMPDNRGWTPLHLVASEGCVEGARLLLLADDVQVDSLSHGGLSPLYLACLGNTDSHSKVVELLLSAGADPDMGSGDTWDVPLHTGGWPGHGLWGHVGCAPTHKWVAGTWALGTRGMCPYTQVGGRDMGSGDMWDVPLHTGGWPGHELWGHVGCAPTHRWVAGTWALGTRGMCPYTQVGGRDMGSGDTWDVPLHTGGWRDMSSGDTWDVPLHTGGWPGHGLWGHVGCAPTHRWVAGTWALGTRGMCPYTQVGGRDMGSGDTWDVPLHTAIEKNHLAAVRMLLEAGADPNIEAFKNTSALHAAAETGSVEVAQLLLDKGGNLNLSGPAVEHSALHMLCLNYRTRLSDHYNTLLDLFLEHGSQVNAQEAGDGAEGGEDTSVLKKILSRMSHDKIPRDGSFFSIFHLAIHWESAEFFGTDHRLVATLKLHVKSRRISRGNHTVFHLEKLKDLTCAHEYAVAVSNRFDVLGALGDPVELWDTFKRETLQAAKECIGERPRSRRGFVSTETLEKIEESRTARLAGNRDQHRALSRRTRTLLGRDKERYVRSLAEDVEGHLNANDLRPAYRALKKLRSKSPSRASAIRQQQMGASCRTWMGRCTIPPDWKRGLVVPIWKGKGDRQDCNNYHGITLLSVPGKVLAHLLLTRIRSHLVKHQRPQQSGFTPGKSTTDRILALRVLVERRREFRQGMLTAYVDLKKAFDSVHLIFAESLEVLVMALEALHEEAKPLGLEVSWLKTKVQVPLIVEIGTTHDTPLGFLLSTSLSREVVDVAKYMIDKGSSVNSLGPGVLPPLVAALKNRHPQAYEAGGLGQELLHYLLSNGAQVMHKMSAELLKTGGEAMIRGLHAVLTAVWQSGTIPPDWKRGLVVPIWKGKGDRQDCNNYHGITLLSVPGKVLAHLLLTRIRKQSSGEASETSAVGVHAW
ncbi:Ankyrin repeat and SOCS box protein 3 [Chionoecetes opilio]|uniref:Ankyrin repeat and SOCS box protein 3 n=1 Tax=Chionoecetes opilio TaxID=41210 RepID=A0A8J4Y675_CHIOP|nr:Ankyrin repeat and SOCS box protein 3 [Chionoecetes opilio]